MLKPVFSGLFSLKGRRNRKPYIQLNLLLVAIAILVLQFVSQLVTSGWDIQQVHSVQDKWDLPGMIYLEVSSYAVGIPFTILVFLAMVQRCHDIGWSGWWALLLPVPFIGFFFWLALFFVRGDRGPNRFGSDPLEPGMREPAV